MADLKTLVTPIFLGVADYWQLAKLGEEVLLDKFRSDIEARLERARDTARGNPDLARVFERVHHPLIFFVDYMVKEGPFTFKDDWRLMSRDFNELSGDEKFFEVLEEILRYSDNPETLQPFYIMLGLGFDGVYHKDNAKIHAYLKQLSEKLKSSFDHRSEYLTKFPVKKQAASKRESFFKKYKLICITAGLAAAALLGNTIFFFIASADFRGAVTSAAANAMVFSTGKSTANADLPTIPWNVPAQSPAQAIPASSVTPDVNPDTANTAVEGLITPPPTPVPSPRPTNVELKSEGAASE